MTVQCFQWPSLTLNLEVTDLAHLKVESYWVLLSNDALINFYLIGCVAEAEPKQSPGTTKWNELNLITD